MPKPERAPLMSLQEVAEYMGVGVKTVRRLISVGDLPAYRVGAWKSHGRLIRVKPADVEALLRRIPTVGQD